MNLKFAKLYPVGIQLLTVAAFSLIAFFFFGQYNLFDVLK